MDVIDWARLQRAITMEERSRGGNWGVWREWVREVERIQAEIAAKMEG